MESILLPLLPVLFMFLFVIMYFILYANFLQKLCSGKWYCGRPRLPLAPFGSRNNGIPDSDETYIQLKAQLTRIALAEAEALRLAKILSENNEHDAREYIANLKMTMFPYNSGECRGNCRLNSNTDDPNGENIPPPSYAECV